VEQVDTLFFDDVRWVMDLPGNAMNRLYREHTVSPWAAAKWAMP
jgi:hypothetical protein